MPQKASLTYVVACRQQQLFLFKPETKKFETKNEFRKEVSNNKENRTKSTILFANPKPDSDNLEDALPRNLDTKSFLENQR
jgi:hypothetical protein